MSGWRAGRCTCETQVTPEVLEAFWARVSGESWLLDLLLADAEEAQLTAPYEWRSAQAALP